MTLSDADQARFLLYAGGLRERAEVLAAADSEADLSRHIDAWEQSKRGGDDAAEVAVPRIGPEPRPSHGSTAEEPRE